VKHVAARRLVDAAALSQPVLEAVSDCPADPILIEKIRVPWRKILYQEQLRSRWQRNEGVGQIEVRPLLQLGQLPNELLFSIWERDALSRHELSPVSRRRRED
jgi:hypothetical protein